MKTILVCGQLISFLFWLNVTSSSANLSSNPLRISTRHFAPFMYQDGNGNFHKGMEFEFMQRMAGMLNVSLHFQATSNHSDVCYDVAMNVSDICIGGIFPTEDTLKYALMSVTYDSDDLTWCVQKAELMPLVLAQMYFLSPGSWFLIIFAYGYACGLLFYILVQFDESYRRRNHCDWHQATWLFTLPAVIGTSSNFRPSKGTVRIFFAFILVTAFFLFQIIFTRISDIFLFVKIPWRQVSSFDEIIDEDFHLMGSQEAFNLLNRNEMIPNHKIESFNVCENVSDCLVYQPNLKKFAIGGSRQNIINSPSYSSSQLFCFDVLENIASYPIALYMRKDLGLATKVNAIVHQLLEAGFFAKWKSDSQIDRKEKSSQTEPIQLSIKHISAVLVYLIGCGSIISTSAFAAENLIYWKVKGRRSNRHSIWIYFEQFFDGRRHYLKDVPQRLQKQNRSFEEPFPYID